MNKFWKQFDHTTFIIVESMVFFIFWQLLFFSVTNFYMKDDCIYVIISIDGEEVD